MIRYSLACGEGHAFEAWFAGSSAYDEQRERGLVLCPLCSSNEVAKALMTPAVSTSRKKAGPGVAEADTPASKSDAPAVSVAAAPSTPALSPEHAEFVSMLRKLRKHVTEKADYVGPRFAEEARRIHFKESEPRGIYGEASPAEIQALTEDGIECHPLPVLPEDRN